jgi:hypothetical protein
LVVSGQVTFWSAATGGTQYTDLLNTVGAAATSITTDSSGQIPAFSGPNTGIAVMWADAGGPSRQVMYATDVPTRLSSLETSSASETARATAAEGLAAQKSANLSDLASASAARTSLGLGTAATQASGAFDAAGAATAAQAASTPAITTTAWTTGALVAGVNTVDATAGAKAPTLPTPTVVGQVLSVEKIDSTANTVTVSGTIRGSSTSVALVYQYESVVFEAESLSSWRPFAGHKTLAQLDATFAPRRGTAQDSYAGKADAATLTGNLDSGQAHTLYALPDSGSAYKLSGGYLTHTLPASGSSAAYDSVNVGARVGVIWAQFKFDAGGGPVLGTGLALSASADTVTKTAHGVPNFVRVIVSSVTGGGLANGTYYTTNVTTDTFQLAANFGGAAVNITADGTCTITGDEPESLALISGTGPMQSPFPPQACHFVMTRTTWTYSYLDNPFAVVSVNVGQFATALVDGTTYTVRVDLRGDFATIEIPELDWAVTTDHAAHIDSQAGTWACVELFAQAAQVSKALKILAWGAEPVQPVDQPVPSRADLAAVVSKATARDKVLGVWQSWTPVISGSGWALGSATVTASYVQIGKVVHWNIRITWASDSTYGATVSPIFTTPVIPDASLWGLSRWNLLNGGNFYEGSCALSASGITLLRHNGSNGLMGPLTATSPVTIVTGNTLQLSGTYKAA